MIRTKVATLVEVLATNGSAWKTMSSTNNEVSRPWPFIFANQSIYAPTCVSSAGLLDGRVVVLSYNYDDTPANSLCVESLYTGSNEWIVSTVPRPDDDGDVCVPQRWLTTSSVSNLDPRRILLLYTSKMLPDRDRAKFTGDSLSGEIITIESSTISRKALRMTTPDRVAECRGVCSHGKHVMFGGDEHIQLRPLRYRPAPN